MKRKQPLRSPRITRDYPEETEGSRLARKVRAACNDLTPAEQRRLLEHAKARIYGKAKRTRSRYQPAA